MKLPRPKGPDYITLFVDLYKKAVAHISDGKSNQTVVDFVAVLEQQKGNKEHAKSVSCDMSPAFIKGIRENLPNAQITFLEFTYKCNTPKSVKGYTRTLLTDEKKAVRRTHRAVADGSLYRYLRHQGKKYRKRYGKNDYRGCIPNRVDIADRPRIVDSRSRIGVVIEGGRLIVLSVRVVKGCLPPLLNAKVGFISHFRLRTKPQKKPTRLYSGC